MVRDDHLLMNFDETIRKMFNDAESATPEQEVQVTVISEPVAEILDDDHRQYNYLHARLPQPKRSLLAHDFNAYLHLHELIQQLLSESRLCLQNSPTGLAGPLLTKLVKPVARPPRTWRICVYCNGTGENSEIAKCTNCAGHGYCV